LYLRRHLGLEVSIAIVSISFSLLVYVVFSVWLKVASGNLVYVGVVNAGLLFVLGHFYSRLKDRRDFKRRRAQELFLEWHSKDIRESRIYVSRWRCSHNETALPTLSSVEHEAAAAYILKYNSKSPMSNGVAAPHELDNPELKELHFFRVYQFFERWSVLVQHSEIDHYLASQYLTSYKAWYLDNIISPWSKTETDQYIRASLESILAHVRPAKGKHDG
jgi:hypothetical protein